MVLFFQASFLFGLIWSLGGSSDSDSRIRFDEFLRNILLGQNEQNPMPSEVGKIECPLPPDGLVYDYVYEVNASWCGSVIEDILLSALR